MVFNFFKFRANFISSKKEKQESVVGLKYTTVSEFADLPIHRTTPNVNNKITPSSDGIKNRPPILLKPQPQKSFDSPTVENATATVPTIITKPEPPELFINDNPVRESSRTASPEPSRSISSESERSASPEPPRSPPPELPRSSSADPPKSILKKTNYETEGNTFEEDENDKKATLIFMTENHDVSSENALVNGDIIDTSEVSQSHEEQVEIKDEDEITNLNEEQIESTHFNEEQIETTNFNDEQIEITHFNEEQIEITNVNEEQIETTNFNEEQIEITNSNEDQVKTTKFNEEQIVSTNFNEEIELPKGEKVEMKLNEDSEKDYKVEVVKNEEIKTNGESKDDYKVHIVKNLTQNEETEVSEGESEEEYEPEYANRSAYSSQAASIFFTGEEPEPPLREKKIHAKDGANLKNNENA